MQVNSWFSAACKRCAGTWCQGRCPEPNYKLVCQLQVWQMALKISQKRVWVWFGGFVMFCFSLGAQDVRLHPLLIKFGSASRGPEEANFDCFNGDNYSHFPTQRTEWLNCTLCSLESLKTLWKYFTSCNTVCYVDRFTTTASTELSDPDLWKQNLQTLWGFGKPCTGIGLKLKKLCIFFLQKGRAQEDV